MESYSGVKLVLKESGSNILKKYVTLNSGNLMPVIGFGTFRIRGYSTILATLDYALQAGYRSFDTAAVYGNEKDIGIALKKLLPKYNLKREDIFLTTKLSPADQGENADSAVRESLKNLDTPYLDLYLIHWPGVSGISVDNPSTPKLRQGSWNVLEKLHDNGKGVLKAIGVSNYTAKHLTELLENSNVPPAVNQVEFHPQYRQPDELYKVCANSNILLQAYSSLGSSTPNSLINHSTVTSLASKYKVSAARLLLRFGLQCGYGIIPKSVTEERIIENSKLDFVIDESDMDKLLNIEEQRKVAWEPSVVV
ncbi:glyoxal reductase [Nilaparvata lugens]|uniref:glyoxal reductase n=1 Tax=Nilaparvata lugens TaxID=108931 RepID=UPI00193E8C25|nr:glyoxal reductase [Nilaparvata lugens]